MIPHGGLVDPDATRDDLRDQGDFALARSSFDEALVGSPGASGLRQILASLDSKQQALLMGHAVPMPITVRTREYGAELFAAVRTRAGLVDAPTARAMESAAKTLF